MKRMRLQKAIGYAAQTGIYAIADDSGLEVDALDGSPGFLSARHGGVGISDVERNHKLLTSLAHIDASKRDARFVSIVVLAKPSEGKSTGGCVLAIAAFVKAGSRSLRAAIVDSGTTPYSFRVVTMKASGCSLTRLNIKLAIALSLCCICAPS